jgi:2-dehydro-3-deoxyphosphogluconate aldolase/(4S)-4-hydroxy-2-oxoglutarate aldolase
LDTLTRIRELGLVPIFNSHDIALAESIVKACYDGGASVVEFTNRGDRAIDIFRQLAVYRDEQLPQVVLGAGSIMDAPTAAMYIAAGADFIVSPVLDEQIAVRSRSRLHCQSRSGRTDRRTLQWSKNTLYTRLLYGDRNSHRPYAGC